MSSLCNKHIFYQKVWFTLIVSLKEFSSVWLCNSVEHLWTCIKQMTGLCIMCMIYTKKQAVQNNEIIVTKNLLINIVLFLCLICVYNLFKFTVSFGQSLLGLQFLNSNKSGEMADILKTLQNKYVAKTDAEILHPTILHGDQLTEERVHNVQWTYHLSNTAVERLEGIEPRFSEFHLKMCLFEVREKVYCFPYQIGASLLIC